MKTQEWFALTKADFTRNVGGSNVGYGPDPELLRVTTAQAVCFKA